MDWDEMARPWLEAEAGLTATHQPVMDTLFAAAKLQPGERVLDVGCGTGPSLVLAADAVGPEGHVTGVDVAPPLIARAAQRVPSNVDLVTADAGTYPFEADSFDIVLANFGIMFFADTKAGFANLRRAVKPSGRLAASFWGLPGDNPWFSMPRRIIDDILTDVPRPDPSGPGPMRFGDPAPLIDALKSSGWSPALATHDLHLTPPGSAEDVAALHMRVTAGMMLKGVEVADSDLDRIRDAITEACRDFDADGQIRVPARVHVVTAQAE